MIPQFRILSLVLICFFFNQCQQSTPKEVREQKVLFKNEGNLSILNDENKTLAEFKIEIADSPYERQTGMMYRDSLEEQHGMLFIFENSELRGFYMKNTLIPLDLIFIDENYEIVHIYSKATPYETASISSQLPAKYVFEINGGLSEQIGIQKGMKIKYNKR
ncbi:MAG: hypothetical protein CBC08_07555 [Flavobacteriaceae bacterium TMED48]|nr:MAG: hypothetical protein CBC08_07555 [Flavobacteriaceae bacterium TMED48]